MLNLFSMTETGQLQPIFKVNRNFLVITITVTLTIPLFEEGDH